MANIDKVIERITEATDTYFINSSLQHILRDMIKEIKAIMVKAIILIIHQKCGDFAFIIICHLNYLNS